VKPGDQVLTSGLGGIFPAGVRIGTVERGGLEPNGVPKAMVVRPAVDFRKLEEVLIYVRSARGGSVPSDFYPSAADSAAADSLRRAAAAPAESLAARALR